MGNLVVLSSLPAAEVRKFSFGSQPSGEDWISVKQDSIYNNESGYGFEAGAKLISSCHGVTSQSPFYFSAQLPEGTYRVRVRLGSDTIDSSTTIKAEARKLMLENLELRSGESADVDLMINIRTPEIQGSRNIRLKDREIQLEWVTWDDRLTLEFNGSRPALQSLEIIPEPDLPAIFLAGDSTVNDQPLAPWNSWGQMLPRFFKPECAVANYAQSGETIRSSLARGRFDKIFSVMKSGDWLLMQFGHNDMKEKSEDALDVYQTNLKNLIQRTRSLGATPVLITSMERKSGVNAPTLKGYPDAVRRVAREMNVLCIDLNQMSLKFYQALGDQLDAAFQDGAHHNNYGSYQLAKSVASALANSQAPIAEFLIESVKDFNPSEPENPDTFNLAVSPNWSLSKPDGN